MSKIVLLLLLSFNAHSTSLTPNKIVHNTPNTDTIRIIEYAGFTIAENCTRKGIECARWKLTKDKGNLPRPTGYSLDRKNLDCQQISARDYGNGYDNGHLVNVNSLDSNLSSMKQSMYMTNILPQKSLMNRGAYFKTERIAECLRDQFDIINIAGTIWGNDTKNDIFKISHGLPQTPDYFYKIIINKKTGESIAWLIPNESTSVVLNLDTYIVSIKTIETLTGLTIKDFVKDKTHKSNLYKLWDITKGCNLN